MKKGKLSVLPEEFPFREHFATCWLEAIENSGARGRLKEALKVFTDRFVYDIMESLQVPDRVPNSEQILKVRAEWCTYAQNWAATEVLRIYAELTSLNNSMHQQPWERAQEERRRKKSKRLRGLADRVVAYVTGQGGTIEFRPAVVAKALSPRKSLVTAHVELAMRWMTKKGMARIIPVSKRDAPRFVLN